MRPKYSSLNFKDLAVALFFLRRFYRLFYLLISFLLSCLLLQPISMGSDRSMGLDRFNPSGDPIDLPGSFGNLSGITYNWDTQTYFVIQNKYANIFEYSQDFGVLLRTLEIKGHPDPDFEGIVYLGQNEFAISNESNHVLVLTIRPDLRGTLSANPKLLEVQQYQLPRPGKSNKGTEGVCYSQRGTESGTFFAVQEDRPKKVFMWSRSMSNQDFSARGWWPNLIVSEPFSAEFILGSFATDLSDCFFNESTGTLLLLSDESSRLIEVNLSGKILSMLELTGAPQFEGVTRGPHGELVFISEPNIVRIYTNPNLH